MRGRLESLPLPALMLVGVLVLVGTGVAGYYAYETYDYIEHDNEFCFSCHLMQQPYELFAQSAHRGLGCKACHQPNLLERSQMGATAVIFDPDEVSAHAAVPNDLCADCHINGDPDKWLLVAQSAGHRVHLESEDPSLDGLQCVECHASSLHEFAAVDRTCAQSGCHTDSAIQLGAMSDLTIHCAACHGFSAPVETAEEGLAALAPDESTCLSCHAMRVLVELPNPDPHEASCASCHNPHEQQTPEEAVASCATADCHSEPVSITAFHEGLEPAVLQDCLYCHQAHDFSIDGSNCLACHTGIMEDLPAAQRMSLDAGSPTPRQMSLDAGSSTPRRTSLDAGSPSPRGAASRLAAAPGVSALHSWEGPLPQTLDFRHSQHPDLSCTECHESTASHGQVTVTTIRDCRSCHHQDERFLADGCASCHADAAGFSDPHALIRTLALSTGATAPRTLPFDHTPHVDVACAQCHTDGLELSATNVDCASCHEEHHEVTTDCRSCHAQPPATAHSVETAHVTCSGAGCHTEVPFAGVPRSREVCLGCHQDMGDHRPERPDCAGCHALPGGDG